MRFVDNRGLHWFLWRHGRLVGKANHNQDQEGQGTEGHDRCNGALPSQLEKLDADKQLSGSSHFLCTMYII